MLSGRHSRTTAALDCAYAALPSTIRLQRVRSAACRKRNHVASGMRRPCSMASSARSRTMAAKPPACNSKSVARIAWSSRDQGFLIRFPVDEVTRVAGEGFSIGAFLHRTQSRCFRLIPFAAADSGSNVSFASIHAQTLPSCVRRARNAKSDGGSPRRCGSGDFADRSYGQIHHRANRRSAAIPVAATSRIVRAAGVSTEG